MTTVLVIGNGESRKDIDVAKYIRDYDTIGCNAIHRDAEVDNIVCCDRRMVEEAVNSENTKHSNIYVRPDWYNYFRKIRKDKRIQQVPDLPYTGTQRQDNPIHWGSGPYAVLLGAVMNYETVMLMGFDLYPKNDKVNNCYKGTENYAAADAKPVDHKYWQYQIKQVFLHYPQKEFIIWNNPDWKLPLDWRLNNVSFESFYQNAS